MSRLGKFLGNPIEIDIEGEKFTLHPLKGKHLGILMSENQSDVQKFETAKKLVRLSLEPSEPVTNEEIDNLPIQILNKLLEEIMKLNGLTEDDTGITKIKREIARRKEAKSR